MKSRLTGFNGVCEALKRGQGTLYVSRKDGRVAELVAAAEQYGVMVNRVSDGDMDRLSGRQDHRGYVLQVDVHSSRFDILDLDDLLAKIGPNALLVLLNGITDPGNLGAILRSCDQFAVDAVIIPRNRSVGKDADSLSRASAGAVEWVPLIEVNNLNRCIDKLKAAEFWIWGADMEGDAAPRVQLTGRTALVMGREGEGLHRLTREKCDGLIRIPTQGHIDSLNVSTAAGILLYESRRQRAGKDWN